MNNRLAIQDLAGLLAEYTGKDKNSSERFLREFIAVVSEGVYTDKLVKVKGLGTFKIIPVEKRESIHVNTGECRFYRYGCRVGRTGHKRDGRRID